MNRDDLPAQNAQDSDVGQSDADEPKPSESGGQPTPSGPLRLGGFMRRFDAEVLAAQLNELWRLTMDAEPAELAGDLELLKRWFDPVAQGSRLRRELQQLTAPPPTWQDPGHPFTLPASGDKRLLTPEGRAAIELLRNALNSSNANDLFIADELVRALERLLLDKYREWNGHRLGSVIGLLEGDWKPLQVSAAGVVLALLVNRCTSPERALTRFARGEGREVIDDAFFAAVNAFATALGAGARGNPANARLISGWMLYEAGRRLGEALILPEARGGHDGAVWIVDGEVPHVLNVVARDLTRGRRGRANTDTLADAFDALVEALREKLPSLAGFGLAHERPLETASLRRNLLRAFDQATSA